MWRVVLAEYAIDTDKLNLWYGTFQALFDVDLQVQQGIAQLVGRKRDLLAQRCWCCSVIHAYNQ